MVENQKQPPKIQAEPPLLPKRSPVAVCVVTAFLTMVFSVLGVIGLARCFPEQWRACIGMKSLTDDECQECARLKERELDLTVNLPPTRRKFDAMSRQPRLLVINVRGEDRNKEDALYVVSGQKVNLLQLRKIVADGVVSDKNMKVLIRGGEYVMHADVARAVAACQDGGVETVNIGYSDKPIE